jgi:hypothetical protein
VAVIARSTKGGGGETIEDGQTFRTSDVDPDMRSLFLELNGELDHQNFKTAEAPGSKSWRYTEISAPGSPGANELKVYAFDIDGTTCLVGKDSSGTVVDLSGRIGARVHNDANISVNNGTLTAVTFNTERYDVGGCHSTSSNTSRLTAPVAGKYVITTQIRFSSDSDYVAITLQFRVNGTTFIAGAFDSKTFATNVVDRNLTTIYSLAANDYVEVLVRHDNTDAGANNIAAAFSSPEFAFAYLGA